MEISFVESSKLERSTGQGIHVSNLRHAVLQPRALFVCHLSRALKHDVSIFCKSFIATSQNIAKLPELLCVVICVMLLYRLPSNIYNVSRLELLLSTFPAQALTQWSWSSNHSLKKRSSRTSKTAVDVPHDMCPQWPCVVVPDLGRVVVDRRPSKGSPTSKSLITRRPGDHLCMSDALDLSGELLDDR